jgi:hypothetical protein
MKIIKDNWINRRYLAIGRRFFHKYFFDSFYGASIPSIGTSTEKKKAEDWADKTMEGLKWE